jgi:hypothetical protein
MCERACAHTITAKQPTLKIFFCPKTVEPQPCTSSSLTEDMEVNVPSDENVDDPSRTVNNWQLPATTTAQFLIVTKEIY